MNLSRRRIDEIVTAVAKALEVDAEKLNDAQFDACCKNVREVLRDGRDDAELGRNIMKLMIATYRAELMHWDGVRAAAANVDSAAQIFLEGNAEKAKEIYKGALTQFEVVVNRRRANFDALNEALTAARIVAADKKDMDASLFFQELLDEHSL